MKQLCNDVIYLILEKMSLRDLLKYMKVNKQFKSIIFHCLIIKKYIDEILSNNMYEIISENDSIELYDTTFYSIRKHLSFYKFIIADINLLISLRYKLPVNIIDVASYFGDNKLILNIKSLISDYTPTREAYNMAAMNGYKDTIMCLYQNYPNTQMTYSMYKFAKLYNQHDTKIFIEQTFPDLIEQ